MKIRSALMTVLVVAVMMLGSGCAPSRDLPDQPPLKDLQSINLCALAPPEQVKIDVSDAIGRGWMRQSLGACWFTTPNGSLWMEQANDRAELPDAVLKEDSETEVQSVTGGRILNSRSGSSARCSQRTLISDRGYVINLNAGASVGDAQCQVLDKMATLVLGNLAADVPVIAWPDGSAGTRDLCAAVTDAGITNALGLDGDVVARADRFDCTFGKSEDLRLSFDTRVEAVKGEATQRLTIGGRPALSTQGGCTLAIDLGDNPVLATMIKDGRDSLDVTLESYSDVSCDQLPAALDPLVRSLAH